MLMYSSYNIMTFECIYIHLYFLTVIRAPFICRW